MGRGGVVGDGAETPHAEVSTLASFRVWLAFALVLAAWVGFLRGSFTDCEEVLSQTGHVVRLCGTPSVAHPAVVSGIAIVGFLVWDQISELSIPGLVSLKRRVEIAEQQTAHIDQRNARMAQDIAQLSIRMDSVSIAAATATATVYNFPITADLIRELAGGLEEKKEVFGQARLEAESHLRATGRVVPGPEDDSDDRTVAILGLISAWERLDRELAVAPPENRKLFESIFQDELNAIRSARNRAAHGQEVSNQALRESEEMADELLRIFLAPHREPPED